VVAKYCRQRAVLLLSPKRGQHCSNVTPMQ
jgi:hypothetical protein